MGRSGGKRTDTREKIGLFYPLNFHFVVVALLIPAGPALTLLHLRTCVVPILSLYVVFWCGKKEKLCMLIRRRVGGDFLVYFLLSSSFVRLIFSLPLLLSSRHSTDSDRANGFQRDRRKGVFLERIIAKKDMNGQRQFDPPSFEPCHWAPCVWFGVWVLLYTPRPW